MMTEEAETCLKLKEDGPESQMETDTSDTFKEVFGLNTDFDSWDEFTAFLEDFQRKSGSCFKLKSASLIDHINETRVHDQIPERFVYCRVKLICVHFGLPTVRGAGHRKSYMGKGCGAFMNVGYSKGALHFTQTHLIHINHPLGQYGNNRLMRQFRAFKFTEEIDLVVAKEIMKQNPFEFINGNEKWFLAINNLKQSDERFASITPRLLKKRIRLLIDRFLAISNGMPPVAEDEMGQILHSLHKTRQSTLNNISKIGRGKRKKNMSLVSNDTDDENEIECIDDDSSTERGGKWSEESKRASKQRRRLAPDSLTMETDHADDDDDECYSDHNQDPMYEVGRKGTSSSTGAMQGKRRRGRPCKKKLDKSVDNNEDGDSSGRASSARKQHTVQNSGPSLTALVRYLHQKDECDRRMRQQEIDLRKEELSLLKQQVELQKQQVERDSTERQALLDYLYAQSHALDKSGFNLNSNNMHTSSTGNTGQKTEFTILDVRKEELSLLKQQIEIQKQQAERDRTERQALLDYLHAQSHALKQSVFNLNSNNMPTSGTGNTSQKTECTILVDNKQ